MAQNLIMSLKKWSEAIKGNEANAEVKKVIKEGIKVNSISQQDDISRGKVLLHACCAICSGQPIRQLREYGYDVIVYFSNNNLDTTDEYKRRLDAEKTLCEYLDTELIIADYEHDKFLDYVKGLENEPEHGDRCLKCFELRLIDTANMAKTLGITKITTSMIISPHKNFNDLCKIGKAVCEKSGLEFLDIDFKKKDGFLKTNKLSKELQLYRQNYCGCKLGVGVGVNINTGAFPV